MTITKRSPPVHRARLAALALLGLSCSEKAAPPLPVGAATPPRYFAAETTDNRFHVAEHFLASIEMQISGEPFAQLLGRDLAGYNRFSTKTDLYTDPTSGDTVVDPLSYSMAIESYEYSKQPMNNTSFESGAGLSLQYGPVLNPKGVTGEEAFVLLRDRLQSFAVQSGTAGVLMMNWVVSPAPTDNPFNYYGWPGFWPVFAEFRSFDPAILPSGGAVRGCSLVGGYAAAAMGAQAIGDYECGANSLNLRIRDEQIESVLSPAALGFALWKQGLWAINYWQSLHDVDGNPITDVDEKDLPQVGRAGNTVVGRYPDPDDPTGMKLIDGTPGVYIGDIPLEGWQGLTMIEEMDNKADLLLKSLLTGDGAKLGGFASTKDALAYDYQSPIRWWPASIGVVESGHPPPSGQAWKDFPQPVTWTIQDAPSRLRGLVGLLGGFAEMFALTDFNNVEVGNLPSSRATFDGDPFPPDNQLPDGEETPHDRALANIKIALVNLDRMHFDPVNKVLVDEATIKSGAVQRGGTVNTVDAAYSIVALRTVLRSLTGSLTLYSNDTPDTAGLPSALDAAPLTGAPAPLPVRIGQLIRAEADFIESKLVAADGQVANSYDLGAGKPDASPSRLESEASAIRGLLEAYLATSETRYRQAAIRIYADMERRFWMADVRTFRTTAGESDTLTWTPVAFGTLQGALRQYWKLVANQAGSERLAAEILERIQRANKLIANGWDDANGDNVVQYPMECTGAGLQMAERTLTGELSHLADGGDRDHDCVREIAAAQLPAALAGEIVLKRLK